MARTYLPPQQKALVWNIVIMVSLVLFALALVVLANLPGFIPFASLFIALAFLLAVPFFYVLYQYNKARQIRYELDETGLQIEWGLNSLVLPIRQIEWAHQLNEFEDEMPLPKWHLPGAYLNLFDVHGMGKTRFVATDPERMILIKADEHYVVISPEDPLAFQVALTERKSLAVSRDEAVSERNFKDLISEMWQDLWLKRLMLAGLGMLALLWLGVGALVALRPFVTYVTMEQVASTQLLLLPVFGTFIWLMSVVIGFFVWTRVQTDKFLVYLLLGSSFLGCLVLFVDSLMMAL